MNNFGLGLVLNLTDNASAGLKNASATMQQVSGMVDQMGNASGGAMSAISALSLAGQGLSVVGNEIAGVGASIVGAFMSATKAVIDTGTTMMGYQMQLNALYGGADAGKKVMDGIKDYATQTVFQVEDVLSSVTIMKAVGIEAMDDITTSSGKHTQKLMDYASDLAAMIPNMRNAYGSGVSASMGAMKEYIAEGNAMSLKRGAGIDITGILGEEKGKSIKERTQQVADLIEKLGIVGFTANLAGTPMQKLSNLQDYLFNAMSDIANSGVMDAFGDLLSKIGDAIAKVVEDEEKYNKLIKVLGSIITTTLKPVSALADIIIGITNAFLEFGATHPKLAGIIGSLVLFSGVALIVVGKLMALTGGIMMFVASVAMFAMAGTTMKATLSGIGSSITKLLLRVLPFVAIGYLLYKAWSTNFGGFRDIIVKNLQPVLQKFKEFLNITKMVINAIRGKLPTKDFKTLNDLGLMPLVDGLKKVSKWFKEVAKPTLINFAKKLSSHLAELIILALKVAVAFIAIKTAIFLFGVAQGIILGVTRAVQVLSIAVKVLGRAFMFLRANPFIMLIMGIVMVLALVYKFRNSIGELGGKIAEMAGSVVEKISGVVSAIPQILSGLLSGLSAMGGSLIKTIVGSLTTVVSVIPSLLIQLSTAFLSALPAMMEGLNQIVPALCTALEQGIPQLAYILTSIIIELITAIVGLIPTLISAITNIIVVLIEAFAQMLPMLIQVGIQLLVAIIQGITTALPMIIQAIVQIIPQLISAITTALPMIIQAIVGVLPQLISAIVQMIPMLIQAIVGALPMIIEAITSSIPMIIQAVIQIIIAVITAIIENLPQILEAIVSLGPMLLQAVIQILVALVKGLAGIPKAIAKAFKDKGPQMRTAFVNAFKALPKAVFTIVKTLVKAFGKLIPALIKLVPKIIKGLFRALIRGAKTLGKAGIALIKAIGRGFLRGVGGFLRNVWNFIRKIPRTVAKGGVGLLKAGLGLIKKLWSGVKNGVSDFLTNVLSFAKSIPEKIKEGLTNLGEIGSNIVSGIWGGISDKAGWIKDQISGWVGDVKNFFKNALGIKSPSRLMRDEVGKFMGEGIAVGFEMSDPLGQIAQFFDNSMANLPQQSEVIASISDNTQVLDGKGYSHTDDSSKLITELGNPTPNNTKEEPTGMQDNRIIFEAGSFVVQVADSSNAELEKVADKLMKIIERKAYLQAQNRRKQKKVKTRV